MLKVKRLMGKKEIVLFVGSLKECENYKKNQLNKFPKRVYIIEFIK